MPGTGILFKIYPSIPTSFSSISSCETILIGTQQFALHMKRSDGICIHNSHLLELKGPNLSGGENDSLWPGTVSLWPGTESLWPRTEPL